MVDMLDTVVPQATVIGSMLIDERCIGATLAQLWPEDFLDQPYRRLFLAIRKLFGADKPVDPVTVLDVVKEDPSVQWYDLIKQCLEVTPTAANVGEYVPILRSQARLNRIQALGERVQAAPDLDSAGAYIDQLNALRVERQGVRVTAMDQALSAFLERQQQKVEYIRWGFEELDRGLHVGPGKFVILGGYASHGKTALALSMAWTMAEKYRVGFYSLETDDATLTDRLVSRFALLSMGKIKRRELGEEDFATVAELSERFIARKLEIVSAAGMTVEDIFASAQSRRYDIIFVDYIQIIRPAGGKGRTEQVTGISIDLHAKAQTTGITVVGLAQLSRPERDGKTQKAPRMSDLRESGQLEQDADVVMMLYREVPDDPNSRRVLSIEKNKEGEVGRLFLSFDGDTQTFRRDYNQTPPPERKRAESEYKQMRFEELPGPDPDMPFQEGK